METNASLHTETANSDSDCVKPITLATGDLSRFRAAYARLSLSSSSLGQSMTRQSHYAHVHEAEAANDEGEDEEDAESFYSTHSLRSSLSSSESSGGASTSADKDVSLSTKDQRHEDSVVSMPSATSSNAGVVPQVQQQQGSRMLPQIQTWSAYSLAALRQWLTAIVVVTFDLDLGQKVEMVYPTDVVLNEADASFIRFSSFPDANASFIGDTVFSFRMQSSPRLMSLSSETTNRSSAEACCLYGYVFFRQKRDDTLRRGFLQKSLVLLTPHAYPGLFLRLVAIMGPLFFETVYPSTPRSPAVASPLIDGSFLSSALVLQKDQQTTNCTDAKKAGEKEERGEEGDEHKTLTTSLLSSLLSSICQRIAAWPPPCPGSLMTLPFLNASLLVDLPAPSHFNGGQLLGTSRLRHASSETTSTPTEHILASLPCSLTSCHGFLYPQPYPTHPYDPSDSPGSSLGLFLRFLPVLDQLWTLWELILLGEPLLVLGRHPAVVSECVWWLRDLIRPLHLHSKHQWWPFVTVQSPLYQQVKEVMARPPSVGGGVVAGRSQRSPFQALFRSSSSRSSFKSSGSTASIQLSHSSSISISSSPSSSSSIYLTQKTAAGLSLRHALTSSANASAASPVAPHASSTASTSSHSVLVGVTNPFFIKAFEGWPHRLKVGGGNGSGHAVIQRKKRSHKHRDAPSPTTTTDASPPAVPTSVPSPSKRRCSSHSTSSLSSLDLSPQLITRYHPFVARDKKLIQTLRNEYHKSFSSNPSLPTAKTSAVKDDLTTTASSFSKGHIFNEVLRRHFVDLTERFLVPLNRYLRTLVPSLPSLAPSTASGIAAAAPNYTLTSPPFKLLPFNCRAFLAHLHTHGPPSLVFRTRRIQSTDWIQMYLRFLDSPQFLGWLTQQKRLAELSLRRAYLKELCRVDISPALRNEGYALFLFTKLRFELLCHGQQTVDGFENKDKTESNKWMAWRVATDDQLKVIQERVQTLWTSLPASDKDRVRQGEFNSLEGSFSTDEDFILVL